MEVNYLDLVGEGYMGEELTLCQSLFNFHVLLLLPLS